MSLLFNAASFPLLSVHAGWMTTRDRCLEGWKVALRSRCSLPATMQELQASKRSKDGFPPFAKMQGHRSALISTKTILSSTFFQPRILQSLVVVMRALFVRASTTGSRNFRSNEHCVKEYFLKPRTHTQRTWEKLPSKRQIVLVGICW